MILGRFCGDPQQRAALKTAKKRRSKLHPNEADVSLAARAFHSVVLSLDAKPGPIKDACQQGGMVVFLTDFDKSGLSLGDFILKRSCKRRARHP